VAGNGQRWGRFWWLQSKGNFVREDFIMTVTITQARNAQSLNSDNTRFDVEINHPQHAWLPYTLDPSDGDMTIDN
tara:strand:+ start:100 stop:324 length:225 start_codon:yes stop_codon:yes gene_type:complete